MTKTLKPKKQLTIAQFLKVNSFPFAIKDKNGNIIYYENSDGCWHKKEFDAKNNLIYCENSNGVINDNRPKPAVELTMDEIATKFGIDIKQLKIKK